MFVNKTVEYNYFCFGSLVAVVFTMRASLRSLFHMSASVECTSRTISSIPLQCFKISDFGHLAYKRIKRYQHSTVRNGVQYNKGKWKPYEDDMLRQAVHKHRDADGRVNWSEVRNIMYGTRNYQQCVDRWSKHLKFQEENNLSTTTNSGIDSLQNYWSEEDDKKLKEAMQLFQYSTSKGVKKVNWNNVLNYFGGTRTYLQCYLRWYLVLNARKLYKRGPWSSDEDDNLAAIVNKHQPKNWSYISQLMESKRSPKQCRMRWEKLQTNLNCSTGRWSVEEDSQLQNAIREYKNQHVNEDSKGIDWKYIANALKTSRTPFQCRVRAEYCESIGNINPWSAEEDSLLKSLVNEFEAAGHSGGIHWEAVVNRMHNRNVHQCRTRWFEHVKLEGQKRRGAFTPREDSDLVAAVQSVRKDYALDKDLCRRGFWVRVGDEFGTTRSYVQCRNRWRVLCESNENLKMYEDLELECDDLFFETSSDDEI